MKACYCQVGNMFALRIRMHRLHQTFPFTVCSNNSTPWPADALSDWPTQPHISGCCSLKEAQRLKYETLSVWGFCVYQGCVGGRYACHSGWCVGWWRMCGCMQMYSGRIATSMLTSERPRKPHRFSRLSFKCTVTEADLRPCSTRNYILVNFGELLWTWCAVALTCLHWCHMKSKTLCHRHPSL